MNKTYLGFINSRCTNTVWVYLELIVRLKHRIQAMKLYINNEKINSMSILKKSSYEFTAIIYNNNM